MRGILLLLIFSISCTAKFTINEAERINTVDAYYRFITENPDSLDVEVALSKIKDMLFMQAVSSRDIILIKRFISEFPTDPRSERLKDLLDEIRFEEAKKKNTGTALEIFRYYATNKELKQKAQEMLFEIEYNKIKNSDDPQQIESFLAKNRDSPHYGEMETRLSKILFDRILKGDVYYAETFLGRFPDDNKRGEIFKILLSDLVDRLSQTCLTDGINNLIEMGYKFIPGKSGLEEILSKTDKNYSECKNILSSLKRLASKDLKRGAINKFFLKKKNEVEIENTLKLLRNYYNNYIKIEEYYKDLSGEDMEKRRLSYLYIKSYPLNPITAWSLIELFINSSILERIELYETIKSLSTEERNRRLFNFIFFVNRDRPIYSVIRGLFFDDTDDYDRENSILNKTFLDSKEDILLQYLLLVKAYEKGYSSFIKSVMNEHLKLLFSTISQLQSSCVDGCPGKILFDIKGVQLILRRESEISKITFGEKSDIYNIISEKEKEISSLLQKTGFSLNVPILNNPSEAIEIDLLKDLKDKSILRIIYQLEPDPAKRECIIKML
ncbi:MAG: hypothetical protein ACP5QK_08715 [Myxococcota bacterium]